MTYLVKALAALLILFAARTVSGEYKKFVMKRTALCEGFASLLSFIKTELACRGRTVAEWAREIDDAALAEVGFTDELIRTQSLSAAFDAAREKMPMLSQGTAKLLDEYFSSFGKAYRGEEEGEACRAFEGLTDLVARERTEAERSVCAIRTLSYAIALGTIILFI